MTTLKYGDRAYYKLCEVWSWDNSEPRLIPVEDLVLIQEEDECD